MPSEQSADGNDRNPAVERDDLPHEVYAAHTDYVRLAMKTMTAKRMVGWLREYAEYCEVSGATTTADHARHMANRLAAEVEPENVESTPEGGETGEDSDTGTDRSGEDGA